MEKEFVTLISGCGEGGAKWAADNNRPAKPIISFDIKENTFMTNPYIVGDILNTGLESNSFNRIIADFLINGIMTTNENHEARYYLKLGALREMWRILAVNGNLEIMDFDYNIDFIKKNTIRFIPDRPLLLIPTMKKIGEEDFKRSNSLKNLANTKNVQKIILNKLSPIQAY